jgi:putative transposase
VTRRKQGSNRRRKAVNLLARAYQKVNRQRQDLHHKAALSLVRHYDIISYEDLQTANLVQNHHLAKSVGDAGWSAFVGILSFKAACAGRSVVAVPPAYTSQKCSGCGREMWNGLSVRWHECPYEDCGVSLDRDHNAALNILALGKKQRNGAGQAPQAPMWPAGASVA